MIEERIKLNSEQEKALKKITNWFHRETESPEQQILTLRGAAGTGKTTLAQYAVELLREANQELYSTRVENALFLTRRKNSKFSF